jgi:uncharacterized membrane protein
MKKISSGLIAVALVTAGSWAVAQTGGGEMMTEGTHRYGYGMMSGYLWWWGLYGVVRVAVVAFALWLLYRITRAVERIASSKS